jgi:hypothetical protein
MFERLVNNRKLTSDLLTRGLGELFSAMKTGGLYGPDEIPWFNGGLFAKIKVPPLEILDVTELRNAAELNWSAIDVSIFGTLFERGLDPAKRSQLGAHYTDPATILRLIEPILTRPISEHWAVERARIQAHIAKRDELRREASGTKETSKYARLRTRANSEDRKAKDTFALFLERLKEFRILPPVPI